MKINVGDYLDVTLVNGSTICILFVVSVEVSDEYLIVKTKVSDIHIKRDVILLTQSGKYNSDGVKANAIKGFNLKIDDIDFDDNENIIY